MSSSKTIYLLPYGGLCNRINAISSSIQFINENHYKLKIYWENSVDLAADFEDLFEAIDMKNVELLKLQWYHILYFRVRKSNLFIPRILRTFAGLNQIENWSSKSGSLNQAIKGDKNYLSTCHAIGEKGDISRVFKPNSILSKELKNVQENFSTNTIGVHIRRGDHAKAIDASPIEGFYTKMDNEILKDANTKFYLATDSEEVKNSLEKKYEGRIITYETPLTRTSISGMHGAIIDLWNLSSCKKVIGTKLSMFSLVSSEIKGVKLDL